MDTPVRYVEVDRTDIAWRIYKGSGERDIVLMFGGTLPIAALSEDPVVVQLIEGMRSLGRVIVFDRRGIGQSGPIENWETDRFELHRRDLQAVLDAADSDHPVVVGHGNACPSILAEGARRGPNSMTAVLCEPPNPWTLTSEQRAQLAKVTIKFLETGREMMELLTPERLAADPGFLSWHVRAGNLGAGPAVAARITAPATDNELAALTTTMDEVNVPLLVIRRPQALRHDEMDFIDPEMIRKGDERFNATRLVELQGRDWMTLIGARMNDVVAEIAEFVTGDVSATLTHRTLRAVLFTDLGGSTALLDRIGDDGWRSLIERHDHEVQRAVTRHGGEVVKTTGDGVLAMFGSASGAFRAATDIRDILRRDALEVRAAVHVGDVELRGDDIAGIAVNIAARVLGHTEPGQIMSTSTAVGACTGAGLTFTSLGRYELRGIGDQRELLRLED